MEEDDDLYAKVCGQLLLESRSTISDLGRRLKNVRCSCTARRLLKRQQASK